MRLFLLIILLFYSASSFASVYEASTLHNAVNRSSSVKDLFIERWSLIEENRYSFDMFGTLNWVNDFQIFTTNRQTGEKHPEDMRLVRTYGGLAYLFPLRSKSNTNANTNRTITTIANIYTDTDTDIDSDINNDDDVVDSDIISDLYASHIVGYRKKPNFLLGFSTYGYHYGLTKSASVKRGDAGNSSVTDYKFTQFFDDIFAVSFFWRTYIHAHTGILVNNAVVPRDDGTMSYFGSSTAKTNWFFASNLFSLMNFNFLVKSNRFETFDISISPTKAYVFFGGELPWFIPDLTLGVKRLAMYNDAPYDSVWVKTNKTELDERDSAKLTLFTLLVEKEFANSCYVNYYMAFQHPSEKLIEKITGEELNLRPVKEVRAAIGMDLLNKMPLWKFIVEAGYSQYWDEAIPVHTVLNKYQADGFFGSFDFGVMDPNFISSGIKFTFSHNNSNELKRLIETTGKTVIQVDLYLSLKLHDW